MPGVPVPQSIIDIYTGRADYPANYTPTSFVNYGQGPVPMLPWISDPAEVARIAAACQAASDQGLPGWINTGAFKYDPSKGKVVYQWMSPGPGVSDAGGGGPIYWVLAPPVPGMPQGGQVYTKPQAVAAAAFAGGLTVRQLPLMIGNQQAWMIDTTIAPSAPPPPDRATAEATAAAAVAAVPPSPPTPTSAPAIAQTQAIAAQVWYPPAPAAPMPQDASGGGGGGGGGGAAAPPAAPGAAPAGGGLGIAAIMAALAAAFLS
jgi:hypothetical protein